MKILYLSCHEILEYDELKLFTELGYECYSLGAYTQPGGEEHRKRPPLELPYSPHFIELSLQFGKENLHPEQLEGIDVVIVMHVPEYLSRNWGLFREFINGGGRVVWRSIGQSIPSLELGLHQMRNEGLEVVRYSPREMTIDHNVGADAVIRFAKDPADWYGWTGEDEKVVNFTQSLMDRAAFTGFEETLTLFTQLPSKVYGPGNENLGEMSGGLLTYDDQREALRRARAFFYHGTYPASYTLSFMEAWMTGTPVVAVGPNRGDGLHMFPGQRTYEVHELIENGVSGFVSDDIDQLKTHLVDLLNDYDLAQEISSKGRSRAIELFGVDTIKEQWKSFLEGGS